MSGRILIGLAPALVGPLILWLLLKNSGLTAAGIGATLASLRPWPLLVLVVGAGLQIALAGEKWRLVESRFVTEAPSRKNAMAYSAVGTALGQILPPPLANAIIRGAGNRLVRGEGARRGLFTSVWEQLFDLGVSVVLCIPALLALFTMDAVVFLWSAPFVAVAADRLVGPVVEWFARLSRLPAPLHDRQLSVTLYRLSLARFATLIVITGCVAWALDWPVDGLQLASVIPPVAVGSVLSFLPAGMGVNEWSFTLLLGHWGAPFATVAAFAVTNRLVVGGTSLLLGAVGLFAVGRRSGATPTRTTPEDAPS